MEGLLLLTGPLSDKLKPLNPDSGYSQKKLYLIDDHPQYLLMDFSECNNTQYEVFKVDNISGPITELSKFVYIGTFLHEHIGNVPKIYAHSDFRMIVQNLGSNSILKIGLQTAKYGILRKSLESAIDWSISLAKTTPDPVFIISQRTFEQKAILAEMSKFITHCLRDISDSEKDTLLDEFEDIANQICEKTCLIHRDFQSANLIYHNNQTYVIDFQDACIGPRFYDLASLMSDLKISLPPKEIQLLTQRYMEGIGESVPKPELVKELAFNCLIRFCKSLTLRYKNYYQTPDQHLYQEIRRGNYILTHILESITKLGYTGSLPKIIRKYLDPLEKCNLRTIILGAGQGKRMGGNQPKVLVECLNVPMIDHCMRTAFLLGGDETYLVVGYEQNMVRKHFMINYHLSICHFVSQNQQLGTGHAVKQVLPHLETFHGNVLVMAGDVPVLSYECLNSFVERFKESGMDAGILTTETPTPQGYGRIIRNAEGKFTGTIEQKDIPSDRQDLEEIQEISTGTTIFKSDVLLDKIEKISNDNAQGEYYLPDVINLLLEEDREVFAYNRPEIPEIHGANNREQLAQIEEWMSNN